MSKVLHERWDRRRLIKVAAGVLIASVADVHLPGSTVAAMTRMRWVERDVFPAGGTYQSAIFEAEQPFNSIETIWRATVPEGARLDFHVRASEDGETWTEWIHVHQDSHIRSLDDERSFGVPILVASGRFVQYRVEIIPNAAGELPRLEEVEIGCVDTTPPAQFLAERDRLIDGWIISRAGWGANESLRFRDGREIWPPRYRPIEKVIIHHTVTQNNEADPAATVRAIYYYHAVTQGWGDIGYNYLIDWRGNVYEGRYGGPGVVGGHARQYNPGSIGVALLGNFTSVEPPRVALDSIVRLIQSKAPNIDPAGIGPFVDRSSVPNICGHRDLLATECPGSRVYDMIPHIRGWCKGTGPIFLQGAELRPSSARLVSVSIAPEAIPTGTVIRVDAVIENTSNATIYTQGPPPGHIYTEGESFDTTGFEKIEGMYRFCLDFEGSGGIINPFRWGLPGPLGPGQRATVTGFVRLTSLREFRFTASLVQEFIRYHQQGIFPQSVTTMPAPIGPAARSNDGTSYFFSVTQHNVPGIFYSFWVNHGGLDRFGYPLTEPFYEVSETDGQTYLTQYFERARFEWHPELAGTPFEVLLGLIARERTAGRENEPPFRPLPPLPPSPNYDYFPETGHTLRAGFRAYWRDHGGLPVFGYPISEEFEELSQTDGQLHVVQYFERARIEWHPRHRGTRYEFLLGHLAREMLIDRGWLPREW